MVRRLAGTMYIKQLAKAVGSSDSTLDRWAKQNGVNINAHKYRPATIRTVCAFYEKHGLVKTKEAFPDISVRSIIERHKLFKARQTRWTNEQIIEAVKMSGLVSPNAQAKFFNRPNAYNGSIKALWTKRFGFLGGSINGMTHWNARELVDSSAQYLKPKGEGRRGEPTLHRWLILWVDLENCLRPDIPDFIRQAIHTMADFQRCLWKSDNPKPLILKMIKEREIA
jgi:hypothetical protein